MGRTRLRQKNFPNLNFELILASFLVVLMASCSRTKIPNKEEVEKFKQWFSSFYSAVENDSALESYVGGVEGHSMKWESEVVGPWGKSKSGTNGGEEFLEAIKWFNSTLGVPEDLTIIVEKSVKRNPYYFFDSYRFTVSVRRQLAETVEVYFLDELKGEFKLTGIMILSETAHSG